MAGTIGIKIANGDFYPIIEENSPVKRRLVLTTVHDKQNSVQIDLFRSISKSMLDAQYIGSLLVEKISSKPKGEPSVEMVISVDSNGNINAEAYDLDAGSNGERHTLNVSLQNMDTLDNLGNAPDFNLNSKPSGYDSSESDDARKFPWLIMGLATLFVALVIAALWFFFLGGKDVFFKDSAPPMALQETQPIQAPVLQPPPPPVQPIQPPPLPPPPPPVVYQEPAASQPVVIKAPVTPPPARPQTAQRVRPMAPVMSYKVPAVIPKNGVLYQIQWGDTLWDISYAFYRNPWYYPRIAKDNKIRNPDFIIAGNNVRIYPRK